MKWFNIIVTAALLYFGNKYICNGYFPLFVLFVCMASAINWHFCKVKDIKSTVLYIFTFTGWLIYTGLGFIRQGFMSQMGANDENLFLIYILYTISTIILFMTIKHMQRKKFRGFGSIINQSRPKDIVIILLICLAVGLSFYRVYLAGGWLSFIYAAYGQKTESSFLTFFNLFSGIMDNMAYVVLPLICLRTETKMRIIAILYFLFTIFMGSINGSSMSLLNPFLALLTYKFITSERVRAKQRLKKYFIIFMSIGVIGGVLIRQNRSNNENFSVNVLDDAIESVLETSTFDNVTNLQQILDLQPLYGIGQFIYPYINYLPRAVFPWKPMEMGRIISYQFKQMDSDKLVGYIPSPIGEFYYDLGYVGVIMGMLFVGFFVGLMQEKLNNTSHPSALLWAYCVGACIYMTIYSGWYTGCFIRLVRMFIFILLINYLSKIIGTKKQLRYDF